ncbi:MAG: hydrogenase formation protein HypD [Candidatus Cloacimonetes bacterium]|nr:hydrogenase formation protein HypD [Candidatus Cloacimonadota bacterium]
MNWNRFRQPDLILKLIGDLTEYKKQVKFMEVCGSHTMAIGHWGLRKLLPENIILISGPGCPVCVTPATIIDSLIKLKSVTITTFGDLMRVPGSHQNLEQARAQGCDIRIVFSPMDALKISQDRETIFIGLGFETTIPGIAFSIVNAAKNNNQNFSVLSLGKLIPPALDALLDDKDLKVDGLILPGHVSTIIGMMPYEFIPYKFGIGGVITGFEPLDIVLGVKTLIENLDHPRIMNEYSRVVRPEGNQIALDLISEVFEITHAQWRGIGEIPDSGLKIKSKYADFDAFRKYDIKTSDLEENPLCLCGNVLKGKILPPECPLFAKTCTPDYPIGPCMVSSEGSCAAYYKYER